MDMLLDDFLARGYTTVGPASSGDQRLYSRGSLAPSPALVKMMTLYPGDAITSGTHMSVGPIVDGDMVTLETERVGRMAVLVRQGQGRANLARHGKAEKAARHN